jgi:hypothetical protein
LPDELEQRRLEISSEEVQLAYHPDWMPEMGKNLLDKITQTTATNAVA